MFCCSWSFVRGILFPMAEALCIKACPGIKGAHVADAEKPHLCLKLDKTVLVLSMPKSLDGSFICPYVSHLSAVY